MKHLIATTNPSGLATVRYARIVLNSSTNDVIVKGGGYEYVDLGLPSHLKWAKCNIGAATETEYGDYFMWGSTTPNTNTICDWEHAPFNGGNSEYNEEYFNAHKSEWLDDNDNGFPTLKPKFDAATQIMGGIWRMPTQDDLNELYKYTDQKWIRDSNFDLIGCKFISTKDTSKYIFIPTSGYRYNSVFDLQGRYGYIWSSSHHSTQYAWEIYVSSDRINCIGAGRNDGKPVRGVRE